MMVYHPSEVVVLRFQRHRALKKCKTNKVFSNLCKIVARKVRILMYAITLFTYTRARWLVGLKMAGLILGWLLLFVLMNVDIYFGCDMKEFVWTIVTHSALLLFFSILFLSPNTH